MLPTEESKSQRCCHSDFAGCGALKYREGGGRQKWYFRHRNQQHQGSNSWFQRRLVTLDFWNRAGPARSTKMN